MELMFLIAVAAGLALAFGPAFVLSANVEVVRAADQEMRTFPVKAAVRIFKGARVGIDPAGYAKPFQPGDYFAGFAYSECDNSSGAAGAKDAKVETTGDWQLAVAGVTIANVGDPVFATADDAQALSGHPDAFIGRVVNILSSGVALVRQRAWGEKPPAGVGSIEIMVDFATEQHANLDENDGYSGSGKLKVTGVGPGLTAGTSGLILDQDNGEAVLLLDNDSEAENISIETARCFNITKGITAEFECRKSVAAATAADIDFGLAGGIDLSATQHADMQATTASFLYALFHMDAEDANVDFCSDDNVTVVAPVDTGVDNDTANNRKYKIILRPGGVAEGWVDGVRKVTETVFGVGAAGLLAGVFNIEKGANTDVPEARLRKMRIAGALA